MANVADAPAPQASQVEEHDLAPNSRAITLDALMIERATMEHVPYLRRLKETVMTSRYRPTTDEAGLAKWREIYCTEKYFTDLLNSPSNMLLSIGSLREPVGMVALRKHPRMLEVDDLLCLYERHGDGHRLLMAAMRYAQAWRLPEMMIDVYPGNKGTDRFLEAHGFVAAEDVTNDLGQAMIRWRRAQPL